MTQHAKICPLTKGKHKWTFVQNIGRERIKFDTRGSSHTLSVAAVYSCECGGTRTGAARKDAPGNDLRDHFPAKEVGVA